VKTVAPWLLALPLFLLLPGCRREDAPDPVPPDGEAWIKPSQFVGAGMDTARVDIGTVGGTVRAWGRLGFDETRVAHVFSPVSGRVTRLLVEPGARVKAGQALAEIESPDLAQALSDERKAQATLDAAERDLSRQKDLASHGAGTVHDLEQAQSVEGNAVAELERARQRTRLLSAGSGAVGQDYVLRSPIAGMVLARLANPGTELSGQYGNGGGPELFTVGDPSGLVLTADVPETDMGRLTAGSRLQAAFTTDPSHPRAGRVDWISPLVDSSTRTVRIRGRLEAASPDLHPQEEAQVTVEVAGRSVLSAPRCAVVRLGGQAFVWTVDGRTADGSLRLHRRPVEVDDAAEGDRVEIRSGVGRGAVVVSRGAILVGA
jgi:cobalt-zinc-cadmium efflux system membrane fusion protein